MTHQIIMTFSLALFFGIIFVIISGKLRMSPIVILLLGGILLGPGAYRLNIIDPSMLGDGLVAIIQISVALILFEGGLTLDIRGFREVSSEIRSALSIGVLITWFGSAALIHYLFEFPWVFSILAGSLIIVTGPTVIGPLLKRVGVNRRLSHFLHWEGVLIDPIGVFIALLCYEWIIGHNAFMLFFSRFLSGIVIGVVSGLILAWIIRRNWVQEESLNIFVLAMALGIFTISDMIIVESGLLSVTIAGFVVGTADTPQIERIRVYKAQLIELLIGLLFILLAANLTIDTYSNEFLIKIALAVTIVMVVLRPLNIFFSTIGSRNFSIREKLFLSWVAPRGIVAASMASLFAINLKASGSEYAHLAGFLDTFTFAVISGTVLLQGFSAGWVARLLGVHEPVPTGWLIVGAHHVGRTVANFIRSEGYAVTLIDTNLRNVAVAHRNGFTAIADNALTADPDSTPELFGIGNVLAITENEELNELICQRWESNLRNPNLYQWRHQGEKDQPKKDAMLSGQPVWGSFPLRQLIKSGEDNQDLSLLHGRGKPGDIRHTERILMSHIQGVMHTGLPETQAEECSFLIYRPFTLRVNLNIKPEWIILSEASSMSEVVRSLLKILQKNYPSLECDEIHGHIMDIEREFSSLVGFNIALPHGYSEVIEESIVMVAKTEGTVISQLNNEEVKLVFLVLSPREKPSEHINTLSEISRFITETENRERLFSASSHKEMVDVFFPSV